jgi:hypothetical protein
MIIPYIHRPRVFIKTLDSIRDHFGHRDDFEILIMESERNYRSEEYHTALVNILSEYPMLRLRLERVFGYTGITPAVAYNYGVCLSKGDMLIFSQPEIRFLDNLLDTLDEQFTKTPKSFILISTLWQAGGKYTWKNSAKSPDGDNLPFTIAMNKEVYKDCGYDLIYASGHCYEDGNWRNRIKEREAPLVISDTSTVVHQPHPKVLIHSAHWPVNKLKALNKELYFKQHPEIPPYKVPPICIEKDDYSEL